MEFTCHFRPRACAFAASVSQIATSRALGIFCSARACGAEITPAPSSPTRSGVVLTLRGTVIGCLYLRGWPHPHEIQVIAYRVCGLKIAGARITRWPLAYGAGETYGAAYPGTSPGVPHRYR